MDLYSSIFTRKSTRNFDPTPIAEETLKQIEAFIASVQPLLPDSKIEHQIVPLNKVKGMGLPKAPHYILISGKEQPLRNACAGFLFQHVELYLYSLGFAARWIASAKSKDGGPNAILGIAFGKPAEPAARKPSDFNRKPVSVIAAGTDSRFEAARLAPSGINGQPWYFIKNGDTIHAYYKKSLGGLFGLMYHFTDLDAGIALCHIAVAGEHEGKPFRFVTGSKNAPTPPKGFAYIGSVE